MSDKKFKPGDYVIVNPDTHHVPGIVVDDWHTTQPYEVRIDFTGEGWRVDISQGHTRLAHADEVPAFEGRAA